MSYKGNVHERQGVDIAGGTNRTTRLRFGSPALLFTSPAKSQRRPRPLPLRSPPAKRRQCGPAGGPLYSGALPTRRNHRSCGLFLSHSGTDSGRCFRRQAAGPDIIFPPSATVRQARSLNGTPSKQAQDAAGCSDVAKQQSRMSSRAPSLPIGRKSFQTLGARQSAQGKNRLSASNFPAVQNRCGKPTRCG